MTTLDGSLYPDVDAPQELVTLGDRVDFLARLCSAWDYGLLPDALTVAEIRKPDWRQAVDACGLLTSPAYHLVRQWHGLPAQPYLGQKLAYITDDPELQHI
jgi:hypothetical protein